MQNRNFGVYLHERAPSSTLSDAASGLEPLPVDIPGAAASLRARGLFPGDFVLLVCDLSPMSARAYLGAIYAGIVPILIHEQDAMRHLDGIRELTGVGTVWTATGRVATNLAGASEDLSFITGLDASPVRQVPAVRADADLAVLMPTSGSTGTPRLVQVDHGNLIANTEAICRSQRLTAEDRALLVLPISYCFGASVLHSHLAVGGHVTFDRRFMFPDKVLDAIDRYRCTTFAGVPSAYRTLVRRSKLTTTPPSSLRRFLQAGGALDTDCINAVRAAVPAARFYVMYGATEATSRCTTLDPDQLDTFPGSVGRPLDNLEIKIVDPQGSRNRELPVGESGEIFVRGPSITSGYYGDTRTTSEKFADRWLRTGDLGHMNEQGYLYIDGRRADFIKTRGIRLSLSEVETFVRTIDGVDDVGACAVAHEEFGEAIRLFVVPAAGYDLADLDTRTRAAIPRNWAVSGLTTIPALPRTSSGKLDRSRLKAS